MNRPLICSWIYFKTYVDAYNTLSSGAYMDETSENEVLFVVL
ncbi:hypothetical protein MKX57_08470 [Lysinibacillus sp. FSL M8-0216]|uniref:Uncharacterized protein n=1 Tax=Lysinibacillus fusiformis TaxID=28031 RepID=A0A1H8ZDU8_9BACI|nr:hypothetical protein [Lysinibacillus fusiformis]SCX90961.1 hypothetical protein SAMN02787081_00556 [Lysinibacillus fusiformis]SEM88822.1 hypothetical protein SAMN02787103_00556 [Lysinibacillus fusiformis]SEP62515.1 hypothetical protein SAMN02787113_00202 [Lysinibacillus fusiformis]